jgi:hypothetical protein
MPVITRLYTMQFWVARQTGGISGIPYVYGRNMKPLGSWMEVRVIIASHTVIVGTVIADVGNWFALYGIRDTGLWAFISRNILYYRPSCQHP